MAVVRSVFDEQLDGGSDSLTSTDKMHQMANFGSQKRAQIRALELFANTERPFWGRHRYFWWSCKMFSADKDKG